MSGQPQHGHFGISEVLAQLRADFPDVSVSKIRFLETEGLLTPARSPSGYRRFSAGDVDRLRYILAAQRDEYLPLRVIRERLARLEAAAAESADGRWAAAEPRSPRPGAPTNSAADIEPSQPLSRRELVETAGLTDALLTELETFGLVRRTGRHYAPESLRVAMTAVALTAYGVEARHLRAVRAAAERETTMIESLVAPIQRQRGAGARELAARTAGEVAELVLSLHGALVEGALAEAGLVQGSLPQDRVGEGDLQGPAGASHLGPGNPDQAAAVEGASA